MRGASLYTRRLTAGTRVHVNWGLIVIERFDAASWNAAQHLRELSRALRANNDSIDPGELAAELEKVAERVTGATWQCQLQTPYAEIYAVGTQDNGRLQYRCSHDPFHTFSG